MLKANIVKVTFNWLEAHGYDMQHRLEPYQRESKQAFFAAEQAAKRRYDALDPEVKLQLPAALEAKYTNRPVLGTVPVYDAIAELATIIDPLDPYLGSVSQLTHQLQLVMHMENDGVDETMILCGLVHDLGKLLIKFGDEDPINVEAGGKKVPLRQVARVRPVQLHVSLGPRRLRLFTLEGTGAGRSKLADPAP